jgi:hypothetical protein
MAVLVACVLLLASALAAGVVGTSMMAHRLVSVRS